MSDAAENTRGIRNAEVRYQNRVATLSTASHVYGKTGGAASENAVPPRGARRTSAGEERATLWNSGYTGSDDPELLLKNPPRMSPFPFFIVSIALLKDFLDVPLVLSVVGVVGSMALSFVVSLVLFFWILGKKNGTWWMRRGMKSVWWRYALTIFIELFPFIQIVPAATILVLLVHFQEVRIVKGLSTSQKAKGA